MAAVSSSEPILYVYPLNTAVNKKDFSEVRRLLSSKATPNELTFQIAGDNVPMLLTLLGTSTAHVKECTDRASLCNAIFPPRKTLTPVILQQLEALPLSDAFNSFRTIANKTDYKSIKCDLQQVLERIAQKQRREIPDLDRLKALQDCTLSSPIEAVKDALLELHPLFAEAWKLVNTPKPLQLQRSDDPSLASNLHTDFNTRTLIVGRQKTAEDYIKMLIEGIVAFLDEQVFLNFQTHPLPRESFVVQSMYMDYMDRKVRGKILYSLFGEPHPFTFDEYWQGLEKTAANQRIKWNTYYSSRFFAQNPHFLNKKEIAEHKAKSVKV